MKKKLMLALIAIVSTAGSLFAQTAAEMSTPAGKSKAAVTKITQLGITEEQRVRAMRVFDYYYAQRAAATGSPDADIAFRNNKLKNIFTDEQMISFKEKFEAELNAL